MGGRLARSCRECQCWCCPHWPSVALADGVGNLYQRMHREGDLLIAGRRVSDIPALLRECLQGGAVRR